MKVGTTLRRECLEMLWSLKCQIPYCSVDQVKSGWLRIVRNTTIAGVAVVAVVIVAIVVVIAGIIIVAIVIIAAAVIIAAIIITYPLRPKKRLIKSVIMRRRRS